MITPADIDAQELDAAAVEYETDTGDESIKLTHAIFHAMHESEAVLEILKRCNGNNPRGVAMQAGIEIGLKLAANVAARKARMHR